ncbi:MAG: trimethylamine methyltransferase family protein [Bacillota bacterium]|nr:trimethylamine methyltransferase family protein [Bacillota bacterium]
MASDVPSSVYTLHSLDAYLSNTVKPVCIATLNGILAEAAVKMAAAVAGGKKALREKPVMIAGTCPKSPLHLDKGICESIIVLAKAGVPNMNMSALTTGGTGPGTLAGTVIVHNAEMLACLVLSQLAQKGAPCIYGSCTSGLDLRKATATYGCPEIGMFSAAFAGALWGTYGTFVTLLSGYGYSETAITAFAPISLILFFLISALIRNPKCLIPTKRNLLIYIICGLIGVLGTNLCYAMALSAGLSVAIASVITFANYFIVMVFSRIIWKVKITPAKIIAGIGAIFGIMLLLQVWTDCSVTTTGLLIILVVTMTFAISYTLTNLSLNDFHSDPDAFYFWINLVGFVALLFMNPPWNVIHEITASVGTYGFVSIATLIGFCLIPQVGSYFCLGRSFLYLDPPSVVIMFSLDPVVAAILGFFVLGQSLTLVQLLGMAIIIASLICLQLADKKAAQKEASISQEQ